MKNGNSNEKGRPYLLLIGSVIWGFAFVAQSAGGDIVGPFSFNFVRTVLGVIVLIPVIKIFSKPITKEEKKNLIKGGICCGLALGTASNLQQVAFYFGSSTGNAGFLTACYIIIVPILGIFLKKKCGINVWISVAIGLSGLYFLCIDGTFKLEPSDICLLLCAVVFSVQILCVDHFSPLVDGVRLSSAQFAVSAMVSFVLMMIFEVKFSAEGFAKVASSLTNPMAWIPIAYAGIMSSGVAYTLQILGQKNVDAAVASLIMSMEAVFSVVGGWLILGEKMSLRELAGCGLIFVAVILAQFPFDRLSKKSR